MNKIKIGVQVTAKVCPTKVTVSGTFQGYELQDKEDPTSVCGKVFYVKDGMQLLDFVYVDSIKVCKGEDEDERIRKELIEYLTHRSEVTGFIDEDKDCKRWIAYLEKQKEQKHPDGCFTCDEYKKGYEEGRRNGFTAGYNKAMKEVEQKEQKPIFKKGDKVIWDDEEFNILDVNETEYNVGGYRVPFSRQNELHPIWQKSAEWSEKYIADVFEKVGLAKIAREQGNDELTNALQNAMLELSKVENVEHYKAALMEWAKLVLKCQERELTKYEGPSYTKASTMGRIDAYKVLIAKLNSL